MQATSQAATQPGAALPLPAPPPRSVLDGFRVRRRSLCAACGGELRLLEERHVVDGRRFHTVCVPAAEADLPRAG